MTFLPASACQIRYIKSNTIILSSKEMHMYARTDRLNANCTFSICVLYTSYTLIICFLMIAIAPFSPLYTFSLYYGKKKKKELNLCINCIREKFSTNICFLFFLSVSHAQSRNVKYNFFFLAEYVTLCIQNLIKEQLQCLLARYYKQRNYFNIFCKS